jgi:hypothetical protein
MTVTLSRDEARNDWLFLDTVKTRSTLLSGTSTAAVGYGERRLQIA